MNIKVFRLVRTLKKCLEVVKKECLLDITRFEKKNKKSNEESIEMSAASGIEKQVEMLEWIFNVLRRN